MSFLMCNKTLFPNHISSRSVHPFIFVKVLDKQRNRVCFKFKLNLFCLKHIAHRFLINKKCIIPHVWSGYDTQNNIVEKI